MDADKIIDILEGSDLEFDDDDDDYAYSTYVLLENNILSDSNESSDEIKLETKLETKIAIHRYSKN